MENSLIHYLKVLKIRNYIFAISVNQNLAKLSILTLFKKLLYEFICSNFKVSKRENEYVSFIEEEKNKKVHF